MEDWFVPQISLYRFPNATFELRVHLHLSHSAHAARLTADDIEITPHGDQLLVSGSVTPHVDSYYHGYPYSRESTPQGTLVWTDQPCGRFGRSVDLGMAPGTEYVILDRRVECGDYVIQYTLRNKHNHATNSCVNIAACTHDPGAHCSSFHPAHVHCHPPNIVPCTPYPAETLGVNATHLPGVDVRGGTHVGTHVVNGGGVGFSAGYGQQETQTMTTAQGQMGSYTLAGTGAGIAAGVGVGLGAGQTGSLTGQVAQVGTTQTTLLGTGQASQVAIGGTTHVGTGPATIVGLSQTSTYNPMEIDGKLGIGAGIGFSGGAEIGSIGAGVGGVGVGAAGTLVGAAQTTQTSTSTSTSTEIDGKFGIGAGIGFSGGAEIGSIGAGAGGSVSVGVGVGAAGTLGAAQTTQTSTSTSTSTEIDGKLGIGAGIGFSGGAEIGSIGAGAGGSMSVGVGVGAAGTLVGAGGSVSVGVGVGAAGTLGAAQTTQTSTSTFTSTEIDGKFGIGAGIDFSAGVGSTGAVVEGGVDVGAVLGTNTSVTLAEASSSSSVQQNAGFSTTHTTESLTEQIAESSTQQISQTSVSAEVDVEISRGRRSTGNHVTFADQETLAEYNGGRVSAQQGQVAWESSSTLVGTEQAAVQSSMQQTSESLTQQLTSSSEVDAEIATGRRSRSAGMHVAFADESSRQHGVAVSERTDVQSSVQTTQTTQASSEVDVGIGSVMTNTRVTLAEKSSGQYGGGRVSEQTQVHGQGVDVLVLGGSEVRQESSVGLAERDSERIVTDVRASMEEDVRTLGQGSVQSSTQLATESSTSTTESSVTTTSETSLTQQFKGSSSQVQVEEASGSRRISQNGYSNIEAEAVRLVSEQAVNAGTSQAVTLGSAQQYYRGSTQEIGESSTQEMTQYESEIDQQSSQHTSLGGQLASAALTLVGQYVSGTESQSVGQLVGSVVGTLAEGVVASQSDAVRSAEETIVSSSSTTRDVAQAAALETVTSSSTEVVQATTEQRGISSSMEIVQSALELAQESVSSSTVVAQTAQETAQETVSSSAEVVQSATQETVSSSTEVAQTVVQESISSSTETAIQETSTVVGSSSTAGIAIFENDECRGAQSSTGILVASARPNVWTSREQGSLEGKNVEATYESVEAHSTDVQEGAVTTTATTATLVTGEDHGVSFESAAVGGRVDTTIVNELEGGVQTSLSAEITRTETTTSSSSVTARQTEEERLNTQTQRITEGISDDNLTQIKGDGHSNGSDHEGSSVHSDNWHVVSGSTGSIKTPALLQTSLSVNQNQAVASSEETLNVSSTQQQQFQSSSSEQHIDTVFSSHRTIAEQHTSSQQTYTTSASETGVVLAEQNVPVSADILHSVSAPYTG